MMQSGPGEKTMSVEKRTDNRIALLGIGGTVRLYDAKKLFGVLKESFEAGDELRIDLTEVAAIDASGIQLIWSACKTAKKAKKKFLITGASEAVLETIRRAGLNHSTFIDNTGGQHVIRNHDGG